MSMLNAEQADRLYDFFVYTQIFNDAEGERTDHGGGDKPLDHEPPRNTPPDAP